MECVSCVVAQQNGVYLDQYPRIVHFDFGEEAALIYAGNSMCISHFNLKRGHDAQYGPHITPGNKRFKDAIAERTAK